MATINNISILMFSPEANSITVSANHDVDVNIKVTTSDGIERYDHTSTYTPVDGTISFGDLSDLVNKCILLMATMREIRLNLTPSPYATLAIAVTDNGNTVTSFAKVFYCTAGNVSDPSTFKVLCTQLRKRYIRENIDFYLLWLPLLATGTTFVVQNTVTYVLNGEQHTAHNSTIYTTSIGNERYQYINAAMPALVRDVLGENLYAEAKVYYYQVDILIDNVIIDSVEFNVDRREYPQESLWYFRNSFGLVDQLLLRGHEDEEHELDATFGYSQWHAVALDAEVRRQLTTHSGWLTKAEFRLVAELCRSPQVSRLEKSGLRSVIVKDIEAVRTSPSNEPQGIAISWQYADKREEWEFDTDGNTLGHNIFADSFSTEFD